MDGPPDPRSPEGTHVLSPFGPHRSSSMRIGVQGHLVRPQKLGAGVPRVLEDRSPPRTLDSRRARSELRCGGAGGRRLSSALELPGAVGGGELVRVA